MVKFALAAATIAVSIACCPRACAADAAFYDGLFQRGERAEGRWEVPKLREWLWKHWYQRTAGTAILSGLPWRATAALPITPSRKTPGARGICRFHLQGSERPMFPGDKAGWRDEWTIAYSVQRVEKPYQWDWPGKPISDSRALPARRYVLELKDKQGKILTHIQCVWTQTSNKSLQPTAACTVNRFDS